jgi:hypothetical protein
MHPTHVPSPHHPSSSNTKKDHVSSPPPIAEASNNFSLLHDNQPSNSSSPLDEPSLDAKKVNATPPSPTTHNHAYELRDFFDGGFSCIENYEMDLDAKDVSFKCVEKPQDKISLIHGDDLLSTNNKKSKASNHDENVPSNPSLPQNNISLIHGDDVISTNNKEIKISQHNENVPSNSSLPLDEAFVDANKVKQTSSSPTTKEDDNEFHSFLNGVFSSMQTYQMEFDVEDVSFINCVEKNDDFVVYSYFMCGF